MNKTLFAIMSVAVVTAVAGGAFYGGTIYSKSQNLRPFGTASLQGFGAGQVRNNGNSNGNSFLSGSIVSKNDNSLTLQLQNGSSKIVFYSDSTQIGKFTSGSPADLAAGQSVMANGTANSDGSITAQSIQIRP